jgi:vitamin B12 transporter
VGFDPSDTLSLGLTFNYANGRFGKPTSVLNEPFDPFASPPKYERIDDFENFSLQLAGDYDATKNFSLRGWAFLNQSNQEDNLYDNAYFNSFNLIAGSFQERVKTRINGLTLQPKYDMGRAGILTLSLSAERDSWENRGPLTVAADTFSQVDAEKSFNIYSADIEYETIPLEGLGLVAGYGRFRQTRSELSEDAYSALAGAYYDVFAATRLKASYKKNVRFPTLSDLYDLTKGNPDLEAERAFTCEAGMEQKLPMNSTVSLTGFYTRARNLIQNDQASGQAMNLTEIDFSGFEVAAATRFINKLQIQASYSYLDSKDKSRAGRDQQQYTPGDKATLEAKYDFDMGFSPYTSLQYVGDQYFYTKNSVTPVQKLKLKDYTLVNIKLSQRLFGNKANLYVGGNNIFDENYETSYGFPQAGRFLYGGAEYYF